MSENFLQDHFEKAMKQQAYDEQTYYRMQNYGQRTIEVNGELHAKSGYSDYSQGLTKVEKFVELDQGSEMWLEGHPYPIRGCINQKTFIIHQFKRLIRTIIISLNGNIFWKIISLLHYYKRIDNYIEFVHSGMRDVYYDNPDRYQQPIREVYRVLTDDGENKVRDIICAVMEHDDAYRYRIQDILTILDKENFENNPFNEIGRVFDIYKCREIYDKLINIGTKIKMLCLYLKFNKKLLEYIKEKVRMLDQDEIKLSPEDIYWTTGRHNYKFRGLPNDQIRI